MPATGCCGDGRKYPRLRVQQTLEALDIFRVAAGLPIIRVTEMLHHTTFWKVHVPPAPQLSEFFFTKQSRDRDGRLNVVRVVVRCANRWEMKSLTRHRTRNGSHS